MRMPRVKEVFSPRNMLVGCAVVMACALPGCWRGFLGETGAAELRKFTTDDEFKQYLSRQVEAQRWQYWWGGPLLGIGSPMLDAAQDPTPLPGTAPEGGDSFSTTNIQEAGVDESDVFKTDGTYLYILDGDKLSIIRAVPADDMQLMSTTELSDPAGELYLRGETLIALGEGYDSEVGARVVNVTILNVTDRSLPSVTSTFRAEARLVTSRLIGSKLHLVVGLWPALPQDDGGTSLMTANVDDLIPDITTTHADGQSETRNLVEVGDLYHPVDPDGYHVTAVITTDVDAPETPLKSVGVVANAGIVYVSTEALYLTDAGYDYFGSERETTDVYKFDLTEDGAVAKGAAVVPGRVLNRFALGEHDGHLRIATTKGHVSRSGEGDARNNVYVLGEEDDGLAIVGKVENIAPGERIYAARFIGDRGFLVTFKKVDPLFTLDLSDPTSPEVVGKLKVPGYSDYIHPLGENHLLTIGKDAIDMGDFAYYQGVQVSVFDVTDFANPRLVNAEIVGDRGTESEALHNPHAFTYFASAGMLAVPMTIAEGAGDEPSARGTRTFEGLCLFTVSTEDGVELAARIATRSTDDLSGWGWGQWTRGLFVGDYVYVVTQSSVRALLLDDLDSEPIEFSLE